MDAECLNFVAPGLSPGGSSVPHGDLTLPCGVRCHAHDADVLGHVSVPPLSSKPQGESCATRLVTIVTNLPWMPLDLLWGRVPLGGPGRLREEALSASLCPPSPKGAGPTRSGHRTPRLRVAEHRGAPWLRPGPVRGLSRCARWRLVEACVSSAALSVARGEVVDEGCPCRTGPETQREQMAQDFGYR